MMYTEPRPIAAILAELLPKYLSSAQETCHPECANPPEFDHNVVWFRGLNRMELFVFNSKVAPADGPPFRGKLLRSIGLWAPMRQANQPLSFVKEAKIKHSLRPSSRNRPRSRVIGYIIIREWASEKEFRYAKAKLAEGCQPDASSWRPLSSEVATTDPNLVHCCQEQSYKGKPYDKREMEKNDVKPSIYASLPVVRHLQAGS